MRHLLKLPLTIAAIVGLNLAGASALAAGPAFDALGTVVAPDLPDDPEPEPDPDPEPNPAIPAGPGDITDDPCDPVEGPCGDPDPDPNPNPDIPEGPGDITDDPCDPVEGPCGDGDPDPVPDPDPDPQPDPQPAPESECGLDEVCEGTPTFTG